MLQLLWRITVDKYLMTFSAGFYFSYIKKSSYWTRVEHFSAAKSFVTVLAIHTWHSAMGNEKTEFYIMISEAFVTLI